MNRDYLAQRMTDELNEIIRVLQLTTYDEDEWDADNLTGMKRQLQVIDSKMTAAYDWLRVGQRKILIQSRSLLTIFGKSFKLFSNSVEFFNI